MLLSEQEGQLSEAGGASLRATLFETAGSNSNIQSLGDDTYCDRDNIL